jgi:hypothetical protein
VQDDSGAVGGGKRVHVLSACDRSGNAGCIALHADALAGHKCSTAVGELDDDRRIDFGSGFHHRVDGVGTGAVGRRERKLLGLGQGKEFGHRITGEDACWKLIGKAHPAML